MGSGNYFRVSIQELLIEQTLHPFGKGNFTSTGTQYSALATSTGTFYTPVETVSIALPLTGDLIQFGGGITWKQACDGTIDKAVGKVQARNAAGPWTDLMAEGTNAAVGTTYEEHTYSGYFATVTNFSTVPFDVRVVIKSNGTTNNARAQVKNSSFVTFVMDAS